MKSLPKPIACASKNPDGHIQRRNGLRYGPLRSCIRSGARAYRILNDLSDALSTLQERGIVHRDVKPMNVLYSRQGLGTATLLDFGFAYKEDGAPFFAAMSPERTHLLEEKISQKNYVGTPGYYSPEQVLSEEITCSSDIFSLGILAYKMLTKHHPFLMDNARNAILSLGAYDRFDQELLMAKLWQEGHSPLVVEAVGQALDRDPTRRSLEPIREMAKEMMESKIKKRLVD